MEDLLPLEVLYEDNHLIAVNKPVGLLIQGDASGEPTLLDAVRHYLKSKYFKPGKVYLGLIHRLDRPVGGVVVLARTSKGAARLSEQFRTHTVEKTYHALVEGEPDAPAGRVEHYLQESGVGQPVQVHADPAPDRKKAVLEYEVLRAGKSFSLLRIRLETGRKHQIRAQMAALGHPLAGDRKYGATLGFNRDGIGLIASSLEFDHATKPEERIRVELPRPAEQEWAAWL
ncbi:RluA family pseudouridine synthase [bacterium]|nr:RluA family pseudouridine synthase [bacterium]